MRLNFCAVILAAAPLAFGQVSETRLYRAVMLTSNEVPAVPINASGNATLRIHVVKNAAGEIISGSTDFLVNYAFPGATTFTGLHIHDGAAGANGSVRVNTGITATNNVVDEDGVGRIERQAQTLPTDTPGLATLNSIWRDPSQHYANLHTTVYTGGAIRGQLQRVETAVLMGVMSTANEIPAITGYNASAVGTLVAQVTRDANGIITSGEVIFDVNYDMPSQVAFTGLHIHSGPVGVNAGVTLNSALARINSSESGKGNLRYRNEIAITNAASVAALEGVFTNPAGYYINLHTADYTNGVVRAQLRPMDLMTFDLALSPSNEVPAANIEAAAMAGLQVYALRNEAGAIIAGHVVFDVNHRFPGETEFTGLHVHDGLAGANGGVRLDSGLSATNTRTSATGFGNIFERVTITDAAGLATLNSLVAGPQRHYLNLHTTTFRGGAVRTQLSAAPAGTPAIGAAISAVGRETLSTAVPAGLLSIYGANLAAVPTDLRGWQGASVPTSLNGTEVTIGGRPAPLLYVSPGQINLQVPVETAPGRQTLIVRADGTPSAEFSVNVDAIGPGVFLYPGGGIVAKNADFTLVSSTNPAAAGEVLVIYLTGMGQTTPPLATGVLSPFSPLANTGTATVTIGGQNAEVFYSVASPGMLGVYQVAVRMPAGVPAGTAAVVVRLGTAQANTVNIATR